MTENIAKGETSLGDMPEKGTLVGAQSHVLVMESGKVPALLVAEQLTPQGQTEHFIVNFDNSLGANGPILANAVLETCEHDYSRLQHYFGGITPGGLPFVINIVPGNSGAGHASCASTTISCDAFSGTDVNLVRMLVVAEVDEVFMAAQNVGWDCGASNGEGLSRVLAAALYPSALNGFTTAAQWLDSNRPDWVNNTDPGAGTSDGYNPLSIGCSVLFLNWLHYQLHFSWQAIVLAGAGTLAQTYTNLTNRNDGWLRFTTLLQSHFPAGSPSGITNDNPFPLTAGIPCTVTQFSPGASFGSWSRLGDAAGLSQMMVISGITGGLEIFAVDTGAGFVWTNWQNGPNGAFEGWVVVGNMTGFRQVTAGRNADGRLEAFALDGDGKVWHTAQPDPSSGFPDWSQLGDAAGLGQMMVISGITGGLEIFAVDTGAGFVWTNWQNGPNGAFEGWVVVGNMTGFRQVTAGRNADGRLEAFALDGDGKVWHTAQPDPSSGFPDWSQLGDAVGIGQLVVISTYVGSLEVFAVDDDAGLAWTIFQNGPNGNFEGWVNMSGISGLIQIEAGKNLDGRLEVFAIDGTGLVWSTVQPDPASAFGAWSRLGDVIGMGQLTVDNNADGRLEVFGLLQDIPSVLIIDTTHIHPFYIEVFEAELQNDPYVKGGYEALVISTQSDDSGSLSVTWTGDSGVQFEDAHARNVIAIFDMTNNTTAGSSQAFQITATVSNSLGTLGPLATNQQTVIVLVQANK